MNILKTLFRSYFEDEQSKGFEKGIRYAKHEFASQILSLAAELEEKRSAQSARLVKRVPSLVYTITDTGPVIGELVSIKVGPTNVIHEENGQIYNNIATKYIDDITTSLVRLLTEGYPKKVTEHTRFKYVVKDLEHPSQKHTYDEVYPLTVPVFNAIYQLTNSELKVLMHKPLDSPAASRLLNKSAMIELLHERDLLKMLIDQTYALYGYSDDKPPSDMVKRKCMLGVYDQCSIFSDAEYAIVYNANDYAFLKGRLNHLKQKHPKKRLVIDFP